MLGSFEFVRVSLYTNEMTLFYVWAIIIYLQPKSLSSEYAFLLTFLPDQRG